MAAGHINLKELAALPGHYVVTPSPDGTQIAYYSEATGRVELYTLDLVTGRTVQLTHGEAPQAPRTGMAWTPDSRVIIFGRDRAGNEKHNLFSLDLATGTVTQLNDDPATAEHPLEVAPDGRSLLVASDRGAQTNLHLFDLNTRDWQELTHFDSPVYGARWSPDGTQIAFAANESANFQNLDVYVMGQDGQPGTPVLSTGDGTRDEVGGWHPDGRRLAITSDRTGQEQAGILDLRTGTVRWLGNGTAAEQAERFSPDGRWLAVSQNRDAALGLVLYEVDTGTPHDLRLPPGAAAFHGFTADGAAVVLSHTTPSQRPSVLLYHLEDDRASVLLPAEYGTIDPAWLADALYIHYPSSGGVEVPALLYRPQGPPPGHRCPALVMPHGGPTGQYYRAFDGEVQFLQDRGFVVLQPNVRGSTGYGVAWRDACIQDWGGKDLDDVVAGARYLRSLSYVDPERLGILGASYGGYLTYIAVTRAPDTFQAAIPIVGITDLPALYDEDPEFLRYYLRQQMGRPEEHQELWRERSATTHAHRVTARLLILHGLNDPRCPASQARLFRDRLLASGKREGIDFEYHEFDEGHGPGADVAARHRYFELIADFLERVL
jgi:dipeptidyl aminopeptidase/acylaminoacyl peptidase